MTFNTGQFGNRKFSLLGMQRKEALALRYFLYTSTRLPRVINSTTFQPQFFDKHNSTERYKGIATTHIKRQLISGDNSYQIEKATTHIKR